MQDFGEQAAKSGPDEPSLEARDAYKSAAWLAFTGLFWEGAQILFGPVDASLAFNTALALHVALAAAGIVYLVRTWLHPKPAFAMLFSSVQILSVLVLIPWASWHEPNMGNVWQSMSTARISLAAIPLVVSNYVGLGYVLVGMVMAEVVIVFHHAKSSGTMVMPLTEPFATLSMSTIGFTALFLRERRKRLGAEYQRTASEILALRKMWSTLGWVQSRLHKELAAVSELLGKEKAARSFGKSSIQQLNRLSDQLAALSPSGETRIEKSIADTECRFQERDGHDGAMTFAVGAIAVSLYGILAIRDLPMIRSMQIQVLNIAIYFATFLWLAFTRSKPRADRTIAATVILFITAAVTLDLLQIARAHLTPVFPFVGQKLLILGVLLVRPRSLWLGWGIQLFIAVQGLILDAVCPPTSGFPLLEPWHTIVFCSLGFGLLTLGEHRRIATIHLLRARVEMAALRRQAEVFMALRDQLNSPMQALAIQVCVLEQGSAAEPAALRKHVESLLSICHELNRMESPPLSRELESFDAAEILKRRT